MSFWGGGGAATAASKALLGNTNFVWGWGYSNNGQRTGQSNANTWSTMIKAPCPDFTHVRISWWNSEATPPTIQALVAPTSGLVASAFNPVEPSVGNTLTGDSTTGWTQVTFSGSSTGTLPASVATRSPGILQSDWIPCLSIPAADGTSTRPYLIVRQKHSGSTFSDQFNTGGVASFNKDSAVWYNSSVKTGDFVASPSGMTAANSTTGSNTLTLAFVEFRSSARVVKVMCIGDSIIQGAVMSPVHNGFPQRTQNNLQASSSFIPINVLNFGSNGANSSEFLQFGKRYVSAYLPAIALYSLYATNDVGSPSVATCNLMYIRAMEFASHCIDNGVLPVFMTVAPRDTYTLAHDQLTRDLIAKYGTAYAPHFIDLRSVVGDGATPERFQTTPVALSGDGIHPNNAGIDLQATKLTEKIQELVRVTLAY